ncbi:hypothetical protein ACFWZ2_35970 [Streptomyces sp. NPDC059002]|uniref:hypothetical protein n=1 Tax=Streptomyces sp. NPDC059002 TaxID=3346690 RepID=UPI0036854087
MRIHPEPGPLPGSGPAPFPDRGTHMGLLDGVRSLFSFSPKVLDDSPWNRQAR